MRLDGIDVLVTRPAGRGGGLVRRLERLGARVHLRPTIAFAPPADGAAVRAAIDQLREFDWILFTSPTGVGCFDAAIDRFGVSRRALRARVGAVGDGTARELEARGFAPALVARESHAEGFGRALRGNLTAGQRALIVRPEVARSVLAQAVRELGGSASEVVFYRTVAAPGIERLVLDVANRRFDAAIFTSPSTLLRLLEAVPSRRQGVERALRGMACVAIGEVTAAAFQDAGLPLPAVAVTPSDEGILDALRSLLAE